MELIRNFDLVVDEASLVAFEFIDILLKHVADNKETS